jgi:hypothetical protein
LDQIETPETYIVRELRHQWGLRVVLLHLARAWETGDADDKSFWFAVAETTRKIESDPDEAYWTEDI